MTINPFRIGAHVTGEFFTDRAAEVRRIAQALREPTRLLLFGARRVGKSSAIAVAAERAKREGILVVRADLSTASGMVDVANRLMASLSRQRSRERLIELASSLAPSVTLTFDAATGAPRIVFGAERRAAAEERQRQSLDEVIEGLAALRGRRERHVAVVLDEFQAVRRFGRESAEWHLRDLIQRHGDISFVCAGSEVSLIQAMLVRERAFFRMFELLHVGPIDAAHLGRWIDSRMEAAGVVAHGIGRQIIERVGPRTQDILQVARHLYARGLAAGHLTPNEIGPALEDVVREEDPVIRAIWTGLTPHQQNVLRAVASGTEQLFSTATRQRFGLPTSSSVAAAVDALEGRGLLVRRPDTGTVEFDNPFIRSWVQQEVMQDVP